VADPLERYNAKRDFTKTAEPAGGYERLSWGEGFAFMVQKHDATRLHYDLRLELDGTLKSWAVTRGPSLDPADKRLAVRTEDHPLSYATFEGTIPKGEYGGGTVMLWDYGTWIPDPRKDPRKTLEQGHLHFRLEGQRMKGEWIMIRLKPRGREKNENWILRKIADEQAGSSGGARGSVSHQRSHRPLDGGDRGWEKKAKELSGLPEADERSSPATGRGTMRSMVEGAHRAHPGVANPPPPRAQRARSPSPVPGRIEAASIPRAAGKATLVVSVPSGSAWITR
jgi:bifunctional non-homologous end joining protein LigD